MQKPEYYLSRDLVYPLGTFTSACVGFLSGLLYRKASYEANHTIIYGYTRTPVAVRAWLRDRQQGGMAGTLPLSPWMALSHPHL